MLPGPHLCQHTTRILKLLCRRLCLCAQTAFTAHGPWLSVYGGIDRAVWKVRTLIRGNTTYEDTRQFLTFWPSKMSLSMPRGPRVERTVSITAFKGGIRNPERGRWLLEGESGGGG